MPTGKHKVTITLTIPTDSIEDATNEAQEVCDLINKQYDSKAVIESVHYQVPRF